MLRPGVWRFRIIEASVKLVTALIVYLITVSLLLVCEGDLYLNLCISIVSVVLDFRSKI